MKIIRESAPADRYLYYFGLCSYQNGWAQVDTAQGCKLHQLVPRVDHIR